MNSSFDNSLLDSSLCVNPDEVCGVIFPTLAQPLNFLDRENMEMTSKVSLAKFSGYPTEDAERFLSNFSAYCLFNRINVQDPRTVAAFQLHLQGPALTWFTCLKDTEKADWASVEQLYRAKYLAENNKPMLLVETEQFLNLRLLPHQQIEDYFSKIMEKGRRVNKSPQEIVLKFIEGLPSQLAFFVRAGNPEDINAALTAAKLGEAYGYRASPTATETVPGGATPVPMPSVSAVQPSSNTRLNDLERKMDRLCSQFEQFTTTKNRDKSPRQFSCHACKGAGHVKRFCNWARGQSEPKIQCQLCEQFGHRAINCGTCNNSGNGRNPRDTGRVPLGGQQ